MAGLFCVGFLGRPLTVKGRFLARLFCIDALASEAWLKTHYRDFFDSPRFRRTFRRDAILQLVWFPAAHSSPAPFWCRAFFRP